LQSSEVWWGKTLKGDFNNGLLITANSAFAGKPTTSTMQYICEVYELNNDYKIMNNGQLTNMNFNLQPYCKWKNSCPTSCSKNVSYFKFVMYLFHIIEIVKSTLFDIDDKLKGTNCSVI
jgi:hypothetical protein